MYILTELTVYVSMFLMETTMKVFGWIWRYPCFERMNLDAKIKSNEKLFASEDKNWTETVKSLFTEKLSLSSEATNKLNISRHSPFPSF